MGKNKPLVAILSGGISSEDYLSRRSCKHIYNILEDGPYKLDILDWHRDGSIEKLSRPEGKTLQSWPTLQRCFSDYKPDTVFNCLHGELENAGQLQGFFTMIGIPCTGNQLASSVIGMDKMLSKDLFRRMGILTPCDLFLGHLHSINPEKSLKDIRKNGLDFPLMLKATHGGSSEGIALLEEKSDFSEIVEEWHHNPTAEYCPIFVEEFIEGKEYCMGIFGHWNQPKIKALPAARIIFEGKIFDKITKFENNYSTDYNGVMPENLLKSMEKAGKDVHRVLKFSGFSRIDFIIKKDSEAYALEVNTHPGMSSHSIIPKMVESSGDFTLKDALTKMIDWSLEEINNVA